jgi:hypothetical protein
MKSIDCYNIIPNPKDPEFSPLGEGEDFLVGLAEFMERTICGTGFGRSSLVIEVARKSKGVRKYALIHESVPSKRYVLDQKQVQYLIDLLKSREF